MIWSIIQGYSGLSPEDKQDLKQDVMVYIWNLVMEQYNPDKGAKFSSFAYRCAVNFINRKLYSRGRKNTTHQRALEVYKDKESEKNAEASEVVHDKLRVVYDMIVRDDDALKPKEKAVILIMIDDPYITQKEIAEIMGYRHPSAISMMMSRIRNKARIAMSSMQT
jgi:RNA polymerase sigma factor (sigma-70 family)